MITIFTDGSSRGNPGPGGWGAIILTEHFAREIGGREEHTTNNRMELTAAIRALESISGLEAETNEIEVHTDSQYVQKGITEWIHGWQKNNWKTAAKKPVENQDLWQALWHNVNGKRIEWKYIAGHAGHRENERCDEIATSFADGAPAELYEGARAAYTIA